MEADQNLRTIGELAEATGITVRTLRHYDAIGLLCPGDRSEGGHRRYGPEEVERLFRILTLRELGFGLAEISSLLDSDRGSLRAATRSRLERVEQELDAAKRLRRRLVAVSETFEDAEDPTTEQLIDTMEAMRMAVRLTRIYTRNGDSGETRLGDGEKVPKTDPRVAACGDVDELNAQIGQSLESAGLADRDRGWLRQIQNDLFDLGADLSVPANSERGPAAIRIDATYIDRLEEYCDEVNGTLAPLASFVLPGGGAAAARLHICRTVCRRAERQVLSVEDVNPEVVRYLNRLSDLLFILARAAADSSERLWEPGEGRERLPRQVA